MKAKAGQSRKFWTFVFYMYLCTNYKASSP